MDEIHQNLILSALKGNFKELQELFGSNLKRIREEKNLSLRTLAANCELDDSQISKIENGKKNIQLSTIFELAKGLNVPPKELLEFPV
ncbi:helix-turn-helix domain-containing protein [Mucilaginibacter lacusdianchii]|uniref:helix-turn-helix domain-containing protein n=1 Tax=Mucilaginibacter lacusdianchii TaxID=2684211 RepID=UPI001E4A6CED|nr:helix-turn-helix transcriptional regulator [Mucilaginibacter sp. JXJ CY 39]